MNITYTVEDHQQISSFVETSDNGYAFAGQTRTIKGDSDFWLVKTDEYGIPEFPSWIILPLLLVATVVVTVARNKLGKEEVRMKRPDIKSISNVFLFLIIM